MSVDKIVVHPAAIAAVEEAAAYGGLNYGFALEAAGKRNAPVRGGHRSFAPGGPVGGNLRRSIHTAVYLRGRRIAGGSDENGRSIPDYPASDAPVVIVVGTNCDYGEWVHDGTSRMAARPFLAEALMETKDQAPALIEAGARRHLGS
jgi:hypothetical protein